MARVMESEAGILDLAGTIEHGSPHAIESEAHSLKPVAIESEARSLSPSNRVRSPKSSVIESEAQERDLHCRATVAYPAPKPRFWNSLESVI